MSNRVLYIFASIVVVFLCAGCASQPPAVSNLSPAHQADRIVVTEVASYRTEKIGLLGPRWQVGLLPGIYIAEKENELGVFYRGEGRRIWVRPDVQEEGPIYIYTGGIWISKGPDLIRLYSYYDSTIHTAKSLKEYDQQVRNVETNGLDAMIISYTYNSIASGKPAVQTAVGAALGGAIVSALIEADNGKINIFEEQLGSGDPEFIAQIKKFIGDSRVQPSPNSSTHAMSGREL